MQRLGIAGLKPFDQLRSLSGSLSGYVKTPPMTTTRPSSNSASHGSFTNLKLTADKLVKEQASVKTDLELAHTKLRKATEQIHLLEAKLQEAINENAKLKVKQAEDTKLWNGLDAKFSSTKTLCDQLCEAVHKLADLNDTAEEDKKFIEEKLLENTKAFDKFKLQIDDFSIKLQCADDKIKYGKGEICKLIREKEEAEKGFKHELSIANEVIKAKGSSITELEDAFEQSQQRIQFLDSQIQIAENELISKENILKNLSFTKDDLEREINMLQCNNQSLKQQIEESCLEIKNLEQIIHKLMTELSHLDEDSLTFSNNVVKLLYSFEKYYDLMHQEKDLIGNCYQGKLEKLQQQLLHVTAESDSLILNKEQLNNKIFELQRAQEFVMVQHADDCRLAEDKARMLESEVDGLLSKKNELETLVTELEGKVKDFSEVSILTENKMHELSQIISKLELENHNTQCTMQLQLQEKDEGSKTLRNEIIKHEKLADSLGAQISELRSALDEKEKLIISFKESEKHQEEQKSEVQSALAAADCKLVEAKKQYDVMLEGKQLELSKHLKELSQKNDQAINEIKKKYETEKEEIVAEEKEKANRLIKKMERNCEEKIMKNREEAEKYLMCAKDEHNTMISKMQQDNDNKELNLRALHKEEMQRIQIHAENEMREKTSSLRKEHEIQMKSLKMQYDDVQRKLQEDLEMQKSKEEKQRKLLQLQWKVMSGNQQDNQEVNSKKEYSTSSIKMRNRYSVKGHEVVLPTPESERKELDLSGYMQTPVSNLLKKVDARKSVPKHQKVTRHEYEVETSNGQTITKRRKTKSTVMIGDPSSHKAMRLRTPNSNKDTPQMTKVTSRRQSHPANIGDLFSEGSLNPYTDDPYAFG